MDEFNKVIAHVKKCYLLIANQSVKIITCKLKITSNDIIAGDGREWFIIEYKFNKTGLQPVSKACGMNSWVLSKRFNVRRKLYMVGLPSTVGKRAKRMPDTTVKTTNFYSI